MMNQLVQATATVPAGGGEASAAVQIGSMFDVLIKGGWLMIPIALCSLIAFAVVAERLVSLRRGAVIPGSFLPGLKQVMRKYPGDHARAHLYCTRNPSPVANVFAAGIKRLGAPIDVVQKHIEEAGAREVLKLRKFLRVLSVIAAIAPLLGLLGTIVGMIIAFQTVAVSGEALGKTELLAKGIYQAMITTAAGLTVAIPVLVCYHWIASRIECLVMEIDLLTVDFLEDYADGLPAAGPSGAPDAVGAGTAVSSIADDAVPAVDGAQVATT